VVGGAAVTALTGRREAIGRSGGAVAVRANGGGRGGSSEVYAKHLRLNFGDFGQLHCGTALLIGHRHGSEDRWKHSGRCGARRQGHGEVRIDSRRECSATTGRTRTSGVGEATGALLGAVLSAEFSLDNRMTFATRIATSAADVNGALLTIVHDGEKSERPLDDLHHHSSEASNRFENASSVLLSSDFQVVLH